MAQITSVNVGIKKRGASKSIEGGKTYTIPYMVTFDSKYEGMEADLFAHASVPRLFSRPSWDYSVRCVSIRPTLESDDGLHWDVDVVYKTQPYEANVDPDNIEDTPDQVSYRFNTYEKVVEKAFQAGDDNEQHPGVDALPTQPIVNGARDPFATPLVVVEHRMVVVIVQYKPNIGFNPSIASEFINRLNSQVEEVGGIAFNPYEGKIVQINISPVFGSQEDPYWKLDIEVELRRGGHIEEVLNEGFYYIDYATGDGSLRNAVDDDGEPMKIPVLLNALGERTEPPPTAANYLQFRLLRAVRWDALDLPADPMPSA